MRLLIVKYWRLLQSEKADLPNLSTELDMYIDSRESQREKALRQISLTFGGIDMVFRFLHEENADSPIVITESAISNVSKPSDE